MTFHASKGLEFDAVYLIRAEEEVTPGKGAGSAFPGRRGSHDTDQHGPEALWEERRMFYVAMTRAGKKLEISWTKYNGRHKNRRSRFLREACGFL